MLEPFIGNDTTYSDELDRKCKKLFGKRFLGVYASNELPKLKNKQMYIANLDRSDQPGSHWIAVYKQSGTNYVYDSFGRPSKRIFKSVFSKGGAVQDAEYDAEQSDKEENCGLRSVVFLYMCDEFGPALVARYL